METGLNTLGVEGETLEVKVAQCPIFVQPIIVMGSRLARLDNGTYAGKLKCSGLSNVVA